MTHKMNGNLNMRHLKIVMRVTVMRVTESKIFYIDKYHHCIVDYHLKWTEKQKVRVLSLSSVKSAKYQIDISGPKRREIILYH